MKNGVFWDVTPCGSCRTDVSEELSDYFIRVTRIGEIGTIQAATSNRRTQSQVPLKRRFLQEPHGITFQKTLFFMFIIAFVRN
jgi:hypothetical protein